MNPRIQRYFELVDQLTGIQKGMSQGKSGLEEEEDKLMCMLDEIWYQATKEEIQIIKEESNRRLRIIQEEVKRRLF